MNFQEYTPLAFKTAKQYNDPVKDLLHGALGMATEAAEFSETLETFYFRLSGDKQPLSVYAPLSTFQKQYMEDLKENFMEEVGDAFWYSALLATHFKFPMSYEGETLSTTNYLPMSGVLQTSGGVIDIAKRAFVYEKEIDLNLLATLVQQNTVAWVRLLNWLCIDLSECLQYNIDKLQKRYSEKYSNEAALARADKDAPADLG